jgi:4-azaleucine resistance transporter AzlC
LIESQSPRAALLAGAKDSIPVIVGGIPFGIIFGALAAAGGRLSLAGTMAMSAFVFAGSAQFIALGMISAGASAALVILTTFVVNLRHMLYSASLGPYLKGTPGRWLIPLGFWLTDESYLIVVQRYERGMQAESRRWYFLGSALAMYLDWQLCTLIGLIAGQSIADPGRWGLDFAMVVTFIGMIIPAIRNRSYAVSVVAAGAVALAANGLPNKLGLILAALVGVGAGMAWRALFKERPGIVAAAEEPS